MKNKENAKYVKLGVTLLLVIAAALSLVFLMFRSQSVGSALSALGRILRPFVYGAVIAYLLAPMCGRLEGALGRAFKGKRDGLASSLSIAVSLLFALLLVLVFALLIVPQLIQSISRLARILPGQIQGARTRFEAFLQAHPDWFSWLDLTSDSLISRADTWVRTRLPSAAQTLLTSAASRMMDVVGVVQNLVLGLIVSIYMLARRRQLAAQARLVLHGVARPNVAQWVESEARFADRMFNGFFMGKLIDSAIVGVICFIGSLIMGFEAPALIAVVVGVTNIIPFFGPYIGAIPCALLLLLENPVHGLMFIVFDVVLQQLDGNFIGPRILSGSTGLSGLWVMFAILLFGGLWGIAGMLVGVPLMAVIYDIMRQVTYRGLRKHGQEALIVRYDAQFHPDAGKEK